MGRLTEQRANDPYILAPEFGAAFAGPDSAASPSDRVEVLVVYQRLRAACGFFMAPVNARVASRSLALQGIAAETANSESCTLSMWRRALIVWAFRGFGYFVGFVGDLINFKPSQSLRKVRSTGP
jgi:hypothetical protein